ncbi:hypothetical protein N7U49_47100 [Streptomyces sp. AD2-2]|nr:hypothetical protein N7U49_47100 [Streptomyces sp. AD2-2]
MKQACGSIWGVGGSSPVRMSVSMKLARSVVALCNHYANLGDW